MKRKLMELKSSRAAQVAAMEKALNDGDKEAFATAKAAVEAANTEIENLETTIAEKSRFAGEPSPVPAAGEPEKKGSKVDGLKTIMKMLKREKLSEAEADSIQKALVTGDNAVSGENYLVPEDVQLQIREMCKSYNSAKEIVNVCPVDTLTGSCNFETGAPAGLTDFDDGDTIATETEPSFDRRSWTIGFRGKLIPVSRVLSNLAAGLNAYLNRWFVRNAIISENAAIFATLKNGYNAGTAKVVAGWEALKDSITVDLDPACKIGGFIVTNQSGFAALDKEKDANGRPILQDNPADPTKKIFQGLPIKVFANAELANIDDTTFPIFYGNTKAGCDFMEYQGLMFDISEHFLFNKNQNCMRVIEGFATLSTDTSAYIYGNFSATPAPAAPGNLENK